MIKDGRTLHDAIKAKQAYQFDSESMPEIIFPACETIEEGTNCLYSLTHRKNGFRFSRGETIQAAKIIDKKLGCTFVEDITEFCLL